MNYQTKYILIHGGEIFYKFYIKQKTNKNNDTQNIRTWRCTKNHKSFFCKSKIKTIKDQQHNFKI